MKDERRVPRLARLGAALLVLSSALLSGCAPARTPLPWAPEPAKIPYSATLRILVHSRGRTASLRAGCAVDPSRGARVEIRDPMGSTRLLLILLPRPTRALLIDPARRVRALWNQNTENLPWVPETLWLALAGWPIEGVELDARARDHLALRGSFSGTPLKGVLTPSAQGPAPFASVEIRGRGVRLELGILNATPGTLTDGALEIADLETLAPVDIWDVLPWRGP